MSDDKVAALIIDNGFKLLKVGFAGDDVPTAVFHTTVGYPTRGVRKTLLHWFLLLFDLALFICCKCLNIAHELTPLLILTKTLLAVVILILCSSLV